jgi:DNA-binding response OmpR family regulator
MAKRILVVDDDENILNLEKTILEQKGFDVTGAAAGRKRSRSSRTGVRSRAARRDDAGGRRLRGLPARSRKTPAQGHPGDLPDRQGRRDALAEGFESGAVMYINKPFTANKLLTIVNTMLESGSNLS